jgi:glycosyltransferase involved in cell wall biosynthesis
MKIGILGNMNNMSFALTRYLRDMGYDCELLIFKDEPEHFHPSNDTDNSGYKTYCKKVEWGDPADFLKQDFSVVAKDLAPYGFLIGHGPAPAYVTKVNRNLDVFMPYGYDLYSLPFFKLVHPLRMAAYALVRHYQRLGIKKSSHILFDKTNPHFEQFFERLGLENKRIVCPFPMVYSKEYDEMTDAGASSDWKEQLKEWRDDHDFLVVQHIRQVWKKSADPWSFKGNHHLIKGYKKFTQQHPKLRSKLILFEYGTDVAASKKLIAALELEPHITWLPKMPRKKLVDVIRIADLLVGELHHSWLTYGGVMEALCLGKPFLHKRDDAQYREFYPELYPNFYADSEATALAALDQAYASRADLKSIGDKGREWFDKYCVTLPLDIITGLIKKKQRAGI